MLVVDFVLKGSVCGLGGHALLFQDGEDPHWLLKSSQLSGAAQAETTRPDTDPMQAAEVHGRMVTYSLPALTRRWHRPFSRSAELRPTRKAALSATERQTAALGSGGLQRGRARRAITARVGV